MNSGQNNPSGSGVSSLTRPTNRLAQLRRNIQWRLFRARIKFIEERNNCEFDRKHGTETAEEIHLSLVGVPDEQVEKANGIYRALWTSEFFSAMSHLKIDHSRFTFIDFGSGKGKVILLA